MTAQLFNFEHRIAQLRALRKKMDDLKTAHKEMMAPYIEVEEKLESAIMQALNATGQNSANTPAGTAYKTEKKSATLEDADAFMRHVIATESWHLLDRKANVTAVADFIEEHKAAPPGVKFSRRYELGVMAPSRANAKK